MYFAHIPGAIDLEFVIGGETREIDVGQECPIGWAQKHLNILQTAQFRWPSGMERLSLELETGV